MICAFLGVFEVLHGGEAVENDIGDHPETDAQPEEPLTNLVRVAAAAAEVVRKRHGISQDKN